LGLDSGSLEPGAIGSDLELWAILVLESA
jgi:hypothetical protein